MFQNGGNKICKDIYHVVQKMSSGDVNLTNGPHTQNQSFLEKHPKKPHLLIWEHQIILSCESKTNQRHCEVQQMKREN